MKCKAVFSILILTGILTVPVYAEETGKTGGITGMVTIMIAAVVIAVSVSVLALLSIRKANPSGRNTNHGAVPPTADRGVSIIPCQNCGASNRIAEGEMAMCQFCSSVLDMKYAVNNIAAKDRDTDAASRYTGRVIVCTVAAVLITAAAVIYAFGQGDPTDAASDTEPLSSVEEPSAAAASSTRKTATATAATTKKTAAATTRPTTTVTQKLQVSYGEKFKYSGFEVEFLSGVKFDTVKNQFSEHNGKVVVGIPVKYKNISDENKSLFTFTAYTSKGLTSPSLWAYFNDSVERVGRIRPGATASGYLYIIYSGNGDYYAEPFLSKDTEARLPVKK